MRIGLTCLNAVLVATLALAAAAPVYTAKAASPSTLQFPEAAIARMSAPIRSRSDLAAYLHRTPSANSPLHFLAPGARQEFLGSLIFEEDGLASFSYAEFGELTASQAYQILSLFGLQSSVGQLGNLKVSTPLDSLILSTHLHPGGVPNFITVPNPPPLRNQCAYFPNHYCFPS